MLVNFLNKLHSIATDIICIILVPAIVIVLISCNVIIDFKNKIISITNKKEYKVESK
jgi:hypothetical protein